jgi:hypothetical protein
LQAFYYSLVPFSVFTFSTGFDSLLGAAALTSSTTVSSIVNISLGVYFFLVGLIITFDPSCPGIDPFTKIVLSSKRILTITNFELYF